MANRKSLPPSATVTLRRARDEHAMNALHSLRALAQRSRIEIFRLVYNAPDGIDDVSISRVFGGLHSSVTLHLAVLTRSGLITGERDGSHTVYRANPQAFGKVLSYLVEDTDAFVPITPSIRS